MCPPRSLLLLVLLSLSAASGCHLCACRHPHENVCDELRDRDLTSRVAYCPSLDLNFIGCQRWFQPSRCVAEDRRQRALASSVPPVLARPPRIADATAPAEPPRFPASDPHADAR